MVVRYFEDKSGHGILDILTDGLTQAGGPNRHNRHWVCLKLSIGSEIVRGGYHVHQACSQWTASQKATYRDTARTTKPAQQSAAWGGFGLTLSPTWGVWIYMYILHVVFGVCANNTRAYIESMSDWFYLTESGHATQVVCPQLGVCSLCMACQCEYKSFRIHWKSISIWVPWWIM